MTKALRQLAWMVWVPSKTIEEIKRDPSWLQAFFITNAGIILITAVTLPYYQHYMMAAAPQTLSQNQESIYERLGEILAYAIPLLTGLMSLITWFSIAAVIWLIVQIFESNVGFKHIFALVSFSHVTDVFLNLITGSFIVYSYHLGADISDLRLHFGLDMFIPSDMHPVLIASLRQINPFTIWFYVLITIGIKVICGFSLAKSLGAIAVFWLIKSFFIVGMAFVQSGNAVRLL